VVGEQGAAEVGEALEMLGFAVVAADESAVAGQPGKTGFDDPAVSAEALGGLDALAGDADLDATALDLGAERSDVVCLVRMEFHRPGARTATFAADRDDRVQQG